MILVGRTMRAEETSLAKEFALKESVAQNGSEPMLGNDLSSDLRWESEMRVKSASKAWGGFYERRAK